MATPHVVGIVSLMFSVNPALTPAQVTQILQSTATTFPGGSTCTTALCGAGIVNAAAAVAAANPGVNPPGAFGKTSPSNGATKRQTTLTLSWAASSGATSYEVCYDTTNDSACSGAWTDVGTATSRAISGLARATTYYWQVRANNASGQTSANGGAWWSFRTR
jgi:serine protease